MRSKFLPAAVLLSFVIMASSAAPAQQGSMTVEHNVDRPGDDYRTFVIDDVNFNTCVQACLDDQRCRAFSFLFPPSPGDKSSCRLKDKAPAPVSHFCCTSGVK